MNGLTAKPIKFVWGAWQLEYLGYVVGNGKIAVPEARVRAIRNFKRPVTKKDLMSFLGTASYYQKFIPYYADNS